jgi:hypothetical protein
MKFRWLYNSLLMLSVSLLIDETASGQHFDIFLARPATGTHTIIGGADVDAQAFDEVTRVFESELAALGDEFIALAPGVNHPNLSNPVPVYPSTAVGLQPGDELRLKERNFSIGGLVNDLFYWNGMGAVSFIPAAANFRIDGSDPLESVAGAGGAFDEHPFLVVDSDALPGIYLASAFGVVDDFDPSAPVYIVMGTEELITAEFLGISPQEFELLSDEELEEALDAVIDPAVDYVQNNIVVPETGSIVLALIACCGMLIAGLVRLPLRSRLQKVR